MALGEMAKSTNVGVGQIPRPQVSTKNSNLTSDVTKVMDDGSNWGGTKDEPKWKLSRAARDYSRTRAAEEVVATDRLPQPGLLGGVGDYGADSRGNAEELCQALRSER